MIRRSPFRVVPALTAIALLGACRSLPAPSAYRQPRPYYLADDLALPLLDPSLMPGTIDMAQRMEGRYRDETFFLDIFTKASGTGVDIVGLDSMGTQVFDLSYSKQNGIRMDSAFGKGRLAPEYVIADFQFAYYPFEAVRTALTARGAGFEERDENGARIRLLSWRGREILRIIRESGGLRVVNSLRGYSYTLTDSK